MICIVAQRVRQRMVRFMLSGKAQGGFTYIGLLMMMAISGIGLAALGEAWHTASQRDKEQELLFVGAQMQAAIKRYYQQTPSPIKEYPATLQALLLDKRGPKPQHHLRRIYIDPMTASKEWGLIKEQERIVGVYSRSTARPFKQDGFSEAYQGFAGAKSYQDWQFSAKQGAESVASSANARTPANSQSATASPASPSSATMAAVAGNGSAGSPEKYASCGATLDAANLACHSGCGALTSPACQSCLGTAFNSYRQCLR